MKLRRGVIMEKNERLELAELLFPNITKTRDYYEELYPERNYLFYQNNIPNLFDL